MNNCSQCGAPLSRLDPVCSFCGTANARRELLSAEVEGLIARGQQAIQQGRPGDAVEFLARAVALEPEAFDAYFQLAAAWNQIGNPERAIDAMLRARDVRPGTTTIYYNIGMLSARLGRRYAARAHYWEALRLLDSDAALSNKKRLFETIYRDLDALGPMTDEEIAQLPKHADGEGKTHNAELLRCLKELDGPRTVGQTLRFYVAFLRSRLLVPMAPPEPGEEGMGPAAGGTHFRPVLVQGPDGRSWYPVFTDTDAVRSYRTNDCVLMPAVSIARLALATPNIEGLVLNPTAAGAGQPIERAGVEAVAKGVVVFLRM